MARFRPRAATVSVRPHSGRRRIQARRQKGRALSRGFKPRGERGGSVSLRWCERHGERRPRVRRGRGAGRSAAGASRAQLTRLRGWQNRRVRVGKIIVGGRRDTASAPQCRKCRRPVNTIARPCSSAAAMTSASFTDPPGCTTAVAPAAASASRPSRNGKNASEATTLPGDAAAGLHHRDLHRVDAAHLAGADRERPIRPGEEDRVRLDVRADAPGEAQRLPLLGGRLALRDDPQRLAGRRRPRLARLDDAVALLDEHAAEDRAQLDAGPRGVAEGREVGGERRAGSSWRRGSAAPPSSTAGAMTASMNVVVMACAVSTSSVRLRPMMPPNADSASASRARDVGLGDRRRRWPRRTGWRA